MAKIRNAPRNRFSGIFRTTSPEEISFFGENPALTMLNRAKRSKWAFKPTSKTDEMIADIAASRIPRGIKIIRSPEQQPGIASLKVPAMQKPKRYLMSAAQIVNSAFGRIPRRELSSASSVPTRRGVDTGAPYNASTSSTSTVARRKPSNARNVRYTKPAKNIASRLFLSNSKFDPEMEYSSSAVPLSVRSTQRTTTTPARNPKMSTGKQQVYENTNTRRLNNILNAPNTTMTGISPVSTRPPRKAHEYRESMVDALNRGNKSEADRLYGEAVERALKRGDRDEVSLIQNTYWGTVRGVPIAPRQDVKTLREAFDDAYNFASRNRNDASAQAEVNRLRGLLAEEKNRRFLAENNLVEPYWKTVEREREIANRAIDTGMSYNVKNLDESVADAVAQRNRGVAGAQDEVNRLRPYLFQEYIDRATRRADVENEPGMSISSLTPQEQRAVRRKLALLNSDADNISLREYQRVPVKKRMTKRSLKKADYFVNNAPAMKQLSKRQAGPKPNKYF
jgi:hypothetical protein